MIFQSPLFAHINSRYHAFKSEVLKDRHCETAQSRASHIDIIQMVLTLIRASRKTTKIACQLYLYAVLPMFIANDHNNYAQYVPV